MITQASFSRIETRAFGLAKKQLQNDTPEMNFLLQQLDRLDLAQKSLSVVGIKNSCAQARTSVLEEFTRTNFSFEQGHAHVEHI